MSVASQFFPSSGGAGGSATEIPVEILGVAGGGGGGNPRGPYNMSGGQGGAGGLFHATNYSIEPGVTVPITIGSGGAGGACPSGSGGIGGSTCFNYPKMPIVVIGGGGGSDASPYGGTGCPGGNGGGGISGGGTNPTYFKSGGAGEYFERCCCFSFQIISSSTGCSAYLINNLSSHEHEKYPWGIKAGYPGLPSIWCCSFPGYKIVYGCGGRSGGNGYNYTYATASPPGAFNCTCFGCSIPSYYYSSITNTRVGYGETVGAGRASALSGYPGALIIKWATPHGAAPAHPGATDISPQTPGYYTYCFTTSGSITLP